MVGTNAAKKNVKRVLLNREAQVACADELLAQSESYHNTKRGLLVLPEHPKEKSRTVAPAEEEPAAPLLAPLLPIRDVVDEEPA